MAIRRFIKEYVARRVAVFEAKKISELTDAYRSTSGTLGNAQRKIKNIVDGIPTDLLIDEEGRALLILRVAQYWLKRAKLRDAREQIKFGTDSAPWDTEYSGNPLASTNKKRENTLRALRVGLKNREDEI
ncbi:hypothetical protein DCC61_02885 [Candidatus Microgenomates bacterium]|nr:hypothetical protein [Candidatus Microgenomates bacterium CPR3]RIK51367.1 MAG: hypothetical protein DCC61_02885 [Candidatus Microgenomates bacterium]